MHLVSDFDNLSHLYICRLNQIKVDHSPKEAIKQIKEKDYKLRFQGKIAEAMDSKTILALGIGYDKETKKHCCEVEWL